MDVVSCLLGDGVYLGGGMDGRERTMLAVRHVQRSTGSVVEVFTSREALAGTTTVCTSTPVIAVGRSISEDSSSTEGNSGVEIKEVDASFRVA